MALLQRFRSMLQAVLVLSTILFGLNGCGGSSGAFDEEDVGVDPDVITVSLTISGQDVAQATPATLTATVMQGTTPLADQLVTFSISDTSLANFDIDVSTKGTNADGQAVINLLAGTSSGSGTITASFGDTESNSVLFTSAGDGGGTGAIVADKISSYTTSQQLGSSGSEELTLTTIAQDANNNLMAGVLVSFSSTSGQVQVTKEITGSDGQATAILKTDNEPTNRIITVTSQSGQAIDTVDIEVKGTTINLNGSSSLAINDETNFFVQVLDSDGEGVASSVVELSLMPPSTGDVAQINIPSSVTVDLTGQASFTVSGLTKGSNTIVASSLGGETEQNVSVQADSVLFSSFSNSQTTVNPETTTLPDVLLSNSATLEVTWLQSNAPVVDGTEVTFTSTRGVLSASKVMTTNGMAQTTLNSSQAGKSIVTVTAVDGNVSLSNEVEFEFVAETVATLAAQASPASIGANGETSTISVIAKDASGNLVKGKVIDFSVSDVSNGTLFPANAITDSNGTASTVYTSNSVSAQNGVQVTAVVRSTPDVSDTVALTVADKELFIALGTGNSIAVTDSTTYQMQYSAFVTDVDSTPKEGVVLTVSAVPHRYYKGEWTAGDGWTTEYSVAGGCPNEDVNIDGILDDGEDTNGSGDLTPGNVVSTLGEVTTDAQGRAIIDILYAKSFASWADVNLIVTAKVAGTESSTHTIFNLPVLSTDVNDTSVSPPGGVESVFGVANDCTEKD